MADSGKQSPLGQNVLGGILQNKCLQINKHAELYMGASKTNASYYPGRLVNNTVLRMLTWSINSAYNNLFNGGPASGPLTDATYKNLISISGNNNECYALGNSMPPTYVIKDPSGVWTDDTNPTKSKAYEYGNTSGPANAGYSETGIVDQEQNATWWDPYNDVDDLNVGVTQWGYIRLHAMQAWNEFNWHGKTGTSAEVAYEDFCNSFLQAEGYINGTNPPVYASEDAQTFGEGSFSNMNDLITADIAGVNLSLQRFGTDLENLGKLFDPRRLDRFGFPSTLLQQLHDGGGITEDLNLSLAAAGLTANEITKISSGNIDFITQGQEKQIYGAFLLVFGQNLINCIAPLSPASIGRVAIDPSVATLSQLRTLADCIDVQRLFPTSWPSMTVPLYNAELGLPTNSKTYYLIYNNGSTGAPTGSINSALDSSQVKERVGTLVCEGLPPIRDAVLETVSTNIPEGFDSYLLGSVPKNVGLTAGAFRYSMLQVTNITQLDPLRLNCFKGLELNENNGDGADGTGTVGDELAKPINTDLQREVSNQLAQGSGYAGTFTFSDFFGCMSGLPYAWQLIFNNINKTGASQAAGISTLATIYQQLYLAVTWEGAPSSGTVQTSRRAEETGIGTGEYNYYYTVTGLTYTGVATGGGYGRAGAPDPAVTISGPSGATATGDIDRNDANSGGVDTDGILELGTYGRVTGYTLTSAGTEVQYASAQPSSTPTDPGLTLSIDTPPSLVYNAFATTGVNNDGNIDFNTVIQDYIDQANDEIPNIVDPEVAYPLGVENLNTAWNVLGKQLKVEQRTRYIAFNPVEAPTRDPFISSTGTIVTFVDSIPTLAQDTRPHMSAQTIEAIVDRVCPTGQSAIAMMRQERNQARLANCGIPLSNNLNDKMTGEDEVILTTNGTIEPSKEGVENNFGDKEWTNPSFPNNPGPSGPIELQPQGYYISPYFYPVVDLGLGDYSYTDIITDVVPPTIWTVNPNINPTGDPVQPDVGGPGGGGPGTGTGNDGNVILIDPYGGGGVGGGNAGEPGEGGTSSGGPGGIPIGGGGGSSPPGGLGGPDGGGPDGGGFSSSFPGSGTNPDGTSGLTNNPVIIRRVVPKSQQTINLNPNYIGGTLQSSGLSTDQAIEQVILCNCDCWDLI